TDTRLTVLMMFYLSSGSYSSPVFFFCLFTSPPPPDFYPLSLHDALPIFQPGRPASLCQNPTRIGLVTPSSTPRAAWQRARSGSGDRKSTRLNSSHGSISYAVFCLKKKKKINENNHSTVPKNTLTYDDALN